MVNYPRGNRTPDTFICHANEDKQYVARPLRDALKEIGVDAWLDESEVRVGDSIRRKIDEGLSACRSATVILSKIFFDKYWTQYEMDGIFQRQVPGEIPLFPIRHGITIEEVASHSPSLADIASLSSSDQTIEQIAADIAGRIPQLRITDGRTSSDFRASRPQGPTNPRANLRSLLHRISRNRRTSAHGSEPERSGLAFFANYTGWLSMVKNDEELEFTIEEKTLRLRLDWGNSMGWK